MLLFGNGLGGYGYGGYGGYGYGGYGGYGYSPYGYGYSTSYGYPSTTYYSSPMYVTNVAPPVDPNAVDPNAAAQPALPANDYATLGETAFRNGDYDGALKNWQHALVDDPQNAVLELLMGQALFAQGRYDDAAGAIQLSQFLLGYYRGFLGNPARAVTDLDQGIKLQPQDQLMQKLRDVMQAKAAAAAEPKTQI